MNIKMTSNFSWTKLLKFITHDKRFGSLVGKEIGEGIVEATKRKIKSNEVTPKTSPRTLELRRNRKHPKSIGGNTTLYDTGKLLNSIKLSATEQAGDYNFLRGLRPIEMVGYGASHQFGKDGMKKREFISVPKTQEQVSQKLMSLMSRAWKKRMAK